MLPLFFFSIRVPTLVAIWWLRFRRQHPCPGHKHPPSFIIFRLDSMGDVVLTTPLFRALKEANPKSRCTVVVQSAYRSLLVTNPYIDEVVSLPLIDRKGIPMGCRRLVAALMLYWTELRHRHFDVAISPRWDVDEHLATLLCVLTNTAKRVGYSCRTSALKQQLNRGFDSAFDTCLPAGPVQHEVERNLAIARALGAPVHERRIDIRVTEKDRREASKHLKGTPRGVKLVAVGIGAASGSRRWPIARYAEALNGLAITNRVWPIIVCAREELTEARSLHDSVQKQASIISGVPLREVCAVLERCEWFIGNDSGCAHLAAAMGSKILVISRHPLGGDPNHFNSPMRFAPWSANVKVLQPHDGRDACETACVASVPHCILNVSVEDVVSEARLLLDSSGVRDNKLMPVESLFSLRRSHAPIVMPNAVESSAHSFKGPAL
jgi:lipopolysaccharide heptosyltransferase II